MKKKMITLMLAAMMAASPAAAFAGETEGSQSQVLFSDDEKGLIYSGAVPVQAETDQAAAPQTEAPDYERMYNDLLAKYNELLKKYSVLLEQESEQ